MKCRSCKSENLELILDLGDQPWCNDFLTKEQQLEYAEAL